MSPLSVLVACEFSGQVRDAFRRHGHNAISCDLLPCERPGPHIIGDVAAELGRGWDMVIAFPPCTYLSRAGARYWAARQIQQDRAVAFVLAIASATSPMIAIENPHGALARRWRRPDQVVQPWWFGADYSKATCLWLKGLPPLMATVVYPSPVTFETAWPHSGSGHAPTGAAWRRRVRAPAGLAEAMARQWG